MGTQRTLELASHRDAREGRTDTDTDTDLVRRASAGSQEAWEELVSRYSGLLWAVARSCRLNDAASADVVQTAWLRLVENLGRIRDPETIGAWLCTTTRREALRLLKIRTRECPSELLDQADRPSEQVDVQDFTADRDRDARVRAAFRRLPERDRLLLGLLMLSPPAGYREVAAALQVPVGSVGPTRARCLARLRCELTALGIDRQSMSA